MKKLMILVLALLMTVAMTACGSDNKDSKADTTEAPATTEAPKTSEASTEAPATEAPTTAEPTTEAPTTAEPTTEAPTTEEPTTEEPTTEAPATEEATTEETASEEATTGEAASEPAGDTAYVNFDKMHFWINGVEFVLGESTLQDMIDSGVVPFRSDDLEDAGNNLKKNTQSSGFRIDLDKYWSAQVYVLNDTDAGKPANECYISEIYLPNHPGETQDILKFDFPLDLTMDQLKANAGEPEGEGYKHYDGDNGFYTDTFKYTKESTKYYGNSYFSFEFTKGELSYVYINYLP